MTRRRMPLLLLLLAMTLAWPGSPRAQPAWPGQPMTLLVPYAAGGITDILARLMAERLSARLGVPVVAENRTGAGGLIAAGTAARAKPDGLTLLMHSSATLAVAASTPNLAFDIMADLAPVAFIAGLPSVLVVNPSVPATTMPQLLAWLRANPGRANCGNLGEGANDHRACLALEAAAGSRMEHLTYRGLPPLNLDLIAGTIQLNLGAAPVQVPLARDGKLRILAVGTAERVPSLPDVPTLLESGVAFDTLASNAIFVPAGTPAAIVARLNAEIAAILAEPEVRARIEATGSVLGPSDVASLAARFRRDWDRANNR
jgi:tripartite-type tricarboxylate transporter receptor subunit TctC